MRVQVVVMGLGSMGAPSAIAVQQVIESFRALGIDVEIAALLDVDERLEGALRFLVRGITPEPKIILLNPDDPTPLDCLASELEIGSSGTNLAVYDATPTRFHWQNCVSATNLPRTVYVGEKPLVTSREELADLERLSSSGTIYCDFIETQSAACLQLLDLVHSGQLQIDDLCFWRLNSSGLAKTYDFRSRQGVQGGALMDKSIHDLSIAAALLDTPSAPVPQITEANPYCFIPCRSATGVRTLLTGYNHSESNLIDGEGDSIEWSADAAGYFSAQWNQSSGHITSSHYFSWIGVQKFDDLAVNNGGTPLESMMEHYGIPLPWLHRKPHKEGYVEEDARILEINGQLNGLAAKLVVNFLSRTGIKPWMWDHNRKREIPIRQQPHGSNSLARVLKQAVFAAARVPQRSFLDSRSTLLCHKALLEARKELLSRARSFEEEWEFAYEVLGRVVLL